jgi:hypothetical protein
VLKGYEFVEHWEGRIRAMKKSFTKQLGQIGEKIASMPDDI